MASKIATFRLPEDLTQEIRHRAEATGRDRTAVVVEALKQTFGFPDAEPHTATVQELQQELDELTKKVTVLSEQLTKATEKLNTPDLSSQTSRSLEQVIPSQRALGIAHSLLPREAFCTQTIGLDEGATSSRVVLQQELEAEIVQAAAQDSGEVSEPDKLELQELTAKISQQARIFDQVLSACPDPIWVFDRVGRFTYVNLATAQLLGLQQSQILGKTWQQLNIPLEAIDPINNQREVVFATKRPLTIEVSYPTINGIRDYECILSPIVAEVSSVEAVICTARDITERNQVEESLRESEANYRHLFEYANDSIFIIDLSTSRVLDANQNASRRLGYTRKELLQLKTSDIDVPITEERQKMINQQMQTTGSIIFEHALRRKNGTQVQVEISSRIIEYHNRLVSLSFVRDTTERKQSQERLRLLESAFFSANDGILITEVEPLDEPGPKVVYVNQGFTQMTGYLPEEVIGKMPRILEENAQNSTQLAQIKVKLMKREAVCAELIDYRKDGSEFWVELNIVPIVDENGWYTHWMAVLRDITARKQRESLFLEKEQQLGTDLWQTNTLLQAEIAMHQRTKAALRESEERYALAISGGQTKRN
ncbi:PAS domain S-box protein [Lyngbya aestuarii]|uniref:PAS domain S-box protein n=1 Tax=Lyngbya aestuarii TaxID=118322 RepID=UPI00403D6FD1